MANKVFSAILLSFLLLGMLTCAFNIEPVKAEPPTIIVPDDYPTIQAAVNAANNGDTVFVRNGTYAESVTINKTLSLIGQDPATTDIAGVAVPGVGPTSALILVYDAINVMNFTLLTSAYTISPPSLEILNCSNINVENCNISSGIIMDTALAQPAACKIQKTSP